MLLAAALVFLTRSAGADESLAVLLEPKGVETVTKEEQARLAAAVNEGLRGAQFQAVPKSDREAIESGEPELKGCRTDECQDRIGRLLSAQVVVAQTWQVKRMGAPAPAPPPVALRRRGAPPPPPQESRDAWQFTATLFNVGIGSVGAKETDTCDSCTLEQAAVRLGELVKKTVLLDAARPRGKIEVASAPAADVLVDGRKLGFTPYKRDAFAGKHEVTVTRTGYRSHHQSVQVEEGGRVTLDVKLREGSDNDYRLTRERGVWQYPVGGALIAAGLILVGLGGRSLDIHGKCTDDLSLIPGNHTTDGMCLQVFDSERQGGALLGVGLTVAALGAVMIAVPLKQRLVKVSMGSIGSGHGLSLAGGF